MKHDSTEKVDTKSQILQATLSLLESQGLQKVTVRNIAAKAGVNVAAVNCHFGTKDRLYMLPCSRCVTGLDWHLNVFNPPTPCRRERA